MKSGVAKAMAEQWGSPPSRGAWIEMEFAKIKPEKRMVAPLAGGVD